MEVPAPNGANTNAGNPAGGIDPKSGTALNYLTDSNSHSPAVSNASAAKTDKLGDKEEQGGMDLDAFLIHFLRNHRDDNFLSVKHGNYTVTSEEAIGEIVDWTMQYLQYM